jgi:acyl-CoA thioesterase FadM
MQRHTERNALPGNSPRLGRLEAWLRSPRRALLPINHITQELSMLSTLHSTRSLPEIQGINLDPRGIAGTGQTFRHTFDIYLKDSNAYANTYFSRYFEWQGVCRERWFHQCISADMLQLKGVFITKRAHTEYLQETFPFQSVECELNTWDVRHCSVYVLFRFRVAQTVVATGYQQIVFAGPDRRIQRFPADMLARLREFELSELSTADVSVPDPAGRRARAETPA